MSYLGPKVYIDLLQLKKNYHIVKSEVGEIPIMATVKANAYGHGAVEVSKALEQEGVRYLAVFTIDEGIELRDAGIKTDIFIYAKFDPTRVQEASKHNLTLNISSFDDLYNFISSVYDVAKIGKESISSKGSSLPNADINLSPIGACPVLTALKISPPLNTDPPGCVTIVSLPPLFSVTFFANSVAFAE